MTLTQRLFSFWLAKLALLLILSPLWTVCYFLPQALAVRTPISIPLWPIDRIVPFAPWWIYPYMSMYLLLPLPPAFATTREQLRRYVIGMSVLFLLAGPIFFLIPIQYPRPPIDPAATGLYRLIVGIDQPINTLPSLHAGLTVFTLLYANKILRDISASRRIALLTFGWLWAGFILYGTLATKQHYFVDLPAGALLALIAHFIAWRNSNVPADEAETITSAAGSRPEAAWAREPDPTRR